MPFFCFSFSSRNKEKEEEESKKRDLKLLDEIVISNPFTFPKTSDFMKIRCETCFNDHTEIIAEVIQNNYILLFHPPRSGKSTLLNTIETFLQKKFNEKGQRDIFQVDEEKTTKAMFFGGYEFQKMFDPLKIANINIGKHNSSKWFGRFPSLFFNFNSLQEAKTEEKLIELLMIMVNNQFKDHCYLLDSLDPSKKEQFDFFKNTKDPVLLYEKILYFCKVLSHFHKEQVAVFIDEFDASFNRLLRQDKPDYEYIKRSSEILTCFLKVLSTQTKDSSVGYIVVTGVYDNILKGELVPNNFTKYTVDSMPFQNYFDLSQEEVEQCIKNMLDLKQSNYGDKLQLLIKTIQLQYNGYSINECKYYNIWSVYSYLKRISQQQISNQAISKVPFNYLCESLSNNTVIIRIFRECRFVHLRNKLLLLGLGYSKRLSYKMNVDLTQPINQLSETQLEQYASSILLHGGYITRNISNDSNLVFPNESNFVIPNEEIRTLFREFIPEFVTYGKGSIREQILEGILTLDKVKIEKDLNFYFFSQMKLTEKLPFAASEEDFRKLEGVCSDQISELVLDVFKGKKIGGGYNIIILKPTENNSEILYIVEVRTSDQEREWLRHFNDVDKLVKNIIYWAKHDDCTIYDQIQKMKYYACIQIIFNLDEVQVNLDCNSRSSIW